jgi:hypothetical protein
MADPAVRIYDIMACNVYWDFANSPWQKEQHKFLISFYPTENVPTPDLIEKITAYGPGGYTMEFKNQLFKNTNLNGFIYDPTLNYYWYMVNLATGYMKAGEYTIEVKCKNGEVLKKSRVQKDGPTEALVPVYLKNWQKIYDSFSPSKTKIMPEGAPLKDVKCSWLTLKDVGNVDAFYVYRIAKGASSAEADTQKLIWWDNIYIQRVYNNDVNAGLNRGHVIIGNELKPETTYAYFVEITDGNVQGDANICIFQPHQIFTTPVASSLKAETSGSAI